jgi:hypothetical protein
MIIEIEKPELEALILERMQRGEFPTVEDALLQALKSSPLPSGHAAAGSNGIPVLTGADLVAAMQASPCKEISLESARDRMPVRDVAF